MLLGLRDGADAAESGRLRSTQLAAGRQLALLLLAANLAGAAAAFVLLGEVVVRWKLIAWATAVAVVSIVVAFRRLRVHHREDGYAQLADLRNTAYEGVALAMVWAAVPILFCHYSDGISAGLGVTLAILMTAASVAMAPLALATLAFLAGLGGATAAQLLFGPFRSLPLLAIKPTTTGTFPRPPARTHRMPP